MSEEEIAKANKVTLAVSYLTLRKAIGLLGISFPFILSIGALIFFGDGIQKSLSDYYYTRMGDVFVGILCALGIFLFSYKGYEKKDDLAGDLACLFVIGVALFPKTPASEPMGIIGIIHFANAALFFSILAYFSLFLFTKSDPQKKMSTAKKRRNQIYRACGVAIVVSILLIAIQKNLPPDIKQISDAYNPVFWLESVAVVAFGFSWLIKGEAILRDET